MNLSEQEVNEKLEHAKKSLELEGVYPSKEVIKYCKDMLNGKITLDEAKKCLVEQYIR